MKLILTIILRLISIIDYAYRRFVQLFLRPLYYREGRCKQCGECCKCILIAMEPRYLKQRYIRNFAIWWNKYFNDLRLLGCLLDDGYIAFACNRQLPDGKCGRHNWLRPWFCSEYPRGFKYFQVPATLPGCGYKFTIFSQK